MFCFLYIKNVEGMSLCEKYTINSSRVHLILIFNNFYLLINKQISNPIFLP